MQRPTSPSWRRIATPVTLAFVSLLAAIVLWIAVTDAENPNEIRDFSAGIEIQAVNLPESQAVFRIDKPVVSLRVSASEDDFKRLSASDFRAEVDLSGARPPSVEQLVTARVLNNRDVDIVSITPNLVTVTLEQSVSKQVPVKVNTIGSPPQGYSVPTPSASPSTVRVTGAASLVQLVESASAEVNLTGLRANLQQQSPLIPRDAQGADIRRVRIEPSNADVRLSVVQQEVALSLTVVPAVQGTVADGYNLVGVSSDPPALAVTGSLEVLQAVSFLTTDSIDVSGLRADATRTVRLRVPAGLQTSRDSVSVRLKVVPAQGEVILVVAPQVTGLGEGLQSSLQTASIDIRLRGELPTLRGLSSENVKATVNVSSLSEGAHVLQPSISLPDGVQVVSVNPAQIVVVLRR